MEGVTLREKPTDKNVALQFPFCFSGCFGLFRLFVLVFCRQLVQSHCSHQVSPGSCYQQKAQINWLVNVVEHLAGREPGDSPWS